MDTTAVSLDPAAAKVLYKKYLTHKNNLGADNEVNREARAAYREIAAGRVVIRALESIRAAGLGPDRLPKLAITRADFSEVCIKVPLRGPTFVMLRDRWARDSRSAIPNDRFSFKVADFPNIKRDCISTAMVPTIPAPYRPQRGLQNYHVLFEAEWGPHVPVDPLLLRRVGKSDLWVVLAAWELTEVEQAVLSTRVKS